MKRILSVSTPTSSVDVFPRILTGCPSGNTLLRSSFDFSVNHFCALLHGETQVKLKSLRLSLSKTFCLLLSVLRYAERRFLSIWISLYFVMQSSCYSCGVFSALLRHGDIDGRANVLKQWDIHRSLCFLDHKAPVVALLPKCQYCSVRDLTVEVFCSSNDLSVVFSCWADCHHTSASS